MHSAIHIISMHTFTKHAAITAQHSLSHSYNNYVSLSRQAPHFGTMQCTMYLSMLDTHQGFFILTHFTHVPKLMYALRAPPLYKIDHELCTLGLMVKNKFEELCNVTLDNTSWQKATLPVRLGGLGLRSCGDLALPCHLASHHAPALLVRQILVSS